MISRARTVADWTNSNVILNKNTRRPATERALITTFTIFFDIRNGCSEQKAGCKYLLDDVERYAAGQRAEIPGSSGTEGWAKVNQTRMRLGEAMTPHQRTRKLRRHGSFGLAGGALGLDLGYAADI